MGKEPLTAVRLPARLREALHEQAARHHTTIQAVVTAAVAEKVAALAESRPTLEQGRAD